MEHTVLIVDDEPTITSALAYAFAQEGYRTILAHSGQEALDRLSSKPDLVVLDIMLPDVDGYQVCRHIRAQAHYTPVLMLTAKDTLPEKVRGLDLGADAYLTKPYQPQELLAQVRALLRFAHGQERTKLLCGKLELDLTDRSLRRDGREIPMTPTEFELLSLLLRRQGQAVGRETLLRHIWQYEAEEVGSRTVDSHILRLRAKIEDNPKEPEILLTVRGFGYRLVCPGE
jgi:DNA-binding response OmpR family regulator